MVKRCAWGTCNSDSRYQDRHHMKDVVFYPIPKPKSRREESSKWVHACSRKNFTVKDVNKHSYACGKHFVDGRPTDRNPFPTKAGHSSTTFRPRRRPPLVRLVHENNIRTVRSLEDKVPTPSMFEEVCDSFTSAMEINESPPDGGDDDDDDGKFVCL
ncbi:uncharacterized protein LOC117318834 [Pecten maximus]|uniref:uncharacterized protein LOC117318834 n=1 Tax=Pecten maximus TaxID=6579 RepID=UPI001458D077|nr:uncharacterized protein LOC117318834 [Pecten maximus]